MRMIDADQMAVDESEAYMSAQVQITDDLKWLVNFAAHSKIQRIIADTPTIDAVPVVRCRECKHHYWEQEPCHGKSVHYCKLPHMRGVEVFKEFFCYYGERKEGADNG